MSATETRSESQVVVVDHVTKEFNGHAALNDVSLAVSGGQIFGLIGPSGSGKTTLVLMMIGMQAPTQGEVRVFGIDPVRFNSGDRERLGYMPQESFLYPTLTAWENMTYVSGLFGISWMKRRKLIRKVLGDLELWDARNKLAGDLSGGMLRRLHLATVLIHNPDLAFIDEPMEGLDPLLRQGVWEILRQMRAHGQTVFMTTHNMEEAERCDNLALISNGRLIAAGAPQDLRKSVLGGQVIRLTAPRFDSKAYAALRSLPGVTEMDVKGRNEIILTVEKASETLPQAVETMNRMGIPITTAEEYEPPFDEVFARLVLND